MSEKKNTEDALNGTESFSYISVYGGVNSDFTKLDLSKFNVRFLQVNNSEFEEYLQKTSPEESGVKSRNQTYFDNLKKEIHKGSGLWALVPIDINVPVDESIFYKIFESLLCMFPSAFRLISILNCQVIDSQYLSWIALTGLDHRFDRHSTDNYLELDPQELDLIQRQLLADLTNSGTPKYLETMILSYVLSFSHNQYPHFSFLGLCICLESLVKSSTEISYQIRRACGVLLGEDIASGQVVFDNVKKIYNLRSKIAHGDDYKYEKVNEYLPYLRALASQIIQDLKVHRITKHENINAKITHLGFGQKDQMSIHGSKLWQLEKTREILFQKLPK